MNYQGMILIYRLPILKAAQTACLIQAHKNQKLSLFGVFCYYNVANWISS